MNTNSDSSLDELIALTARVQTALYEIEDMSRVLRGTGNKRDGLVALHLAVITSILTDGEKV